MANSNLSPCNCYNCNEIILLQDVLDMNDEYIICPACDEKNFIHIEYEGRTNPTKIILSRCPRRN